MTIDDHLVPPKTLTALVLNPPYGGSKKGAFLKNTISPPKKWVTRPVFGKILNQIQIYPAHALSRVFSVTIEIFRETNALLTDTLIGGLMGMMRKTVKWPKILFKLIYESLWIKFQSSGAQNWLKKISTVKKFKTTLFNPTG